MHSKIGWIQWWNDSITRTTHVLSIYGKQLAILGRRSYESTIIALKKASKDVTLNPFDIYLKIQIAKFSHEK